MENASDALIMAGSVLLFVIGLTVAVLSFSQAREAIDTVIKFSDREYLTIENDQRYFYVAGENKTRNVGLDTVIPTLYRAIRENFIVVFNFKDGHYLYQDTTKADGEEYINKIDLSIMKGIGLEKTYNDQNKIEEVHSNANQFLNGIIFGINKDVMVQGEDTSISEEDYRKKFSAKLPTDSLYDYLKNKTINEKLGMYDMNDELNEDEDTRCYSKYRVYNR